MNRLAHYQNVHHGICWWCARNLGHIFTSVEGLNGTALRVHYGCRKQAEDELFRAAMARETRRMQR